jgi:broad specificity phosphatase PhoE
MAEAFGRYLASRSKDATLPVGSPVSPLLVGMPSCSGPFGSSRGVGLSQNSTGGLGCNNRVNTMSQPSSAPPSQCGLGGDYSSCSTPRPAGPGGQYICPQVNFSSYMTPPGPNWENSSPGASGIILETPRSVTTSKGSMSPGDKEPCSLSRTNSGRLGLGTSSFLNPGRVGAPPPATASTAVAYSQPQQLSQPLAAPTSSACHWAQPDGPLDLEQVYLFSSPLTRCVETAHSIATGAGRNMPILIEDSLVEGMKWIYEDICRRPEFAARPNAVKPLWFDAAHHQLHTSSLVNPHHKGFAPVDVRFPGHGLEESQHCWERCAAGAKQMLGSPLFNDPRYADATVVLVAHGISAIAWYYALTGRTTEEDPPFTGFVELVRRPQQSNAAAAMGFGWGQSHPQADLNASETAIYETDDCPMPISPTLANGGGGGLAVFDPVGPVFGTPHLVNCPPAVLEATPKPNHGPGPQPMFPLVVQPSTLAQFGAIPQSYPGQYGQFQAGRLAPMPMPLSQSSGTAASGCSPSPIHPTMLSF